MGRHYDDFADRRPARPRRGVCRACGKKNDLYPDVCLKCIADGVRPTHGDFHGGSDFVDHSAHGHPPVHPPGGHLTAAERARLKPSDFALPKTRDLPIHRRAYIGPATARLEMMIRIGSVSRAEASEAKRRIARAARYFGVESKYAYLLHD